jgi:hypothetical protein
MSHFFRTQVCRAGGLLTLLAGVALSPHAALAQTPGVGIGTTTPDPAAVLDIKSSTQGLLPPRLTTTQRDALTTAQSLGAAQAGLLIFNTTTSALNQWNGYSWVAPLVGNASGLLATYAYTGAAQTYVVPAGVTLLRVTASGASGGNYNGQTGYAPGARVAANVPVTPGETLTIVVGGQGGRNAGTNPGGYNGGGGGGGNAGGGGGATEIRRAPAAGATGDYLASRNALVVAGGSGGTDSGALGGAGGTPTGADGLGSVPNGASPTAPGGGPYAGTNNGGGTSTSWGGGGGGYYGGGGGSAGGGAGGGGGSSWALAGATAVTYGLESAAGNGQLTLGPAQPEQVAIDGSTITNLSQYWTRSPLGLYPTTLTDNVGIGNANPLQPLHIGSTARPLPTFLRLSAGNGSANRSWDLGVPLNAASPGDVTGENYDFALRDATANATRLLVEWNTGNVGINTRSPRGKLDVRGGDTYLVASPDTGSSQSVFLPGHLWLAPYSGTGGNAFIQARVPNPTATTNLGLVLRTTNAGVLTEAVNIGSSGNTAVAGSVRVDAATANDAGTSYSTGSPLQGLLFGSGGTGEGIGSKRTAGGNNYGLNFYTNFTSRVAISNGGNVGINTNTPNRVLTVQGTGANSETMQFRNLQGRNRWHFNLPAADTSSALNFAETNVADFRLYLRPGGLVGINTNAPNTRLSISPSATEAKLTLFDGGSTTAHYGFGISASQLNYHVAATSAAHVFYAGGKNGDGTELMRLNGDGSLRVQDASGEFNIHNFGASATNSSILLAGLYGRNGNGTQLRFAGAGTISSFVDIGQSAGGSFVIETNDNARFVVAGHDDAANEGNVGIGVAVPANHLDIANNPRTGTHPTDLPLYVTNNNSAASNGVEFRNTNATQGIGFGFNTMYAAGTNTDQDLNLLPRGTGKVGVGLTNPSFGIDLVAPTQLGLRVRSANTIGTWLNLTNTSTGGGGFQVISTGSGNSEGANKLLITTGIDNVNSGNLMAIDGATHFVGIGTTSPTSTLDVNGSEALAYSTTGSNTSFTLTAAHRTVRRFGTCTTITVPQASTCPGRIYTIINSNGQGAFTLTVTGGGSVYDDIANVTYSGTNAFPAATRLTIQSDGSGWIVIGR